MIPVTYSAPAERTSPRWAAAFAEGCGGIVVDDGRIRIRIRIRPGPTAFFGSPFIWPVFQQAIAEKRDWYYGDHAYFGRGRYFRCTTQAMQHSGAGAAPADSEARFNTHGIKIEPWRKTGGHIVIAPNSPGFFALQGMDFEVWLEEMRETLLEQTDRPIILHQKRDFVPLAARLRGAWALVTFTSNSAVEAALAGIPVFCTAPCAGLAFGTGDLASIEKPVMPCDDERFRIACVLAANQWTLEEMRAGMTWRALQAAREAA